MSLFGELALPGPAVPAACHLAEAPDTAGPPSSANVKHTSSSSYYIQYLYIIHSHTYGHV